MDLHALLPLAAAALGGGLAVLLAARRGRRQRVAGHRRTGRRGTSRGLRVLEAAGYRIVAEEVVREADSHGAKIDLTRLEHLGGAESDMLARYLHMIQVQRQDFNGRMLTIRRDDMRAIACILGVSYEAADSRVAELGLSMG